jgi:hypothetical protein
MPDAVGFYANRSIKSSACKSCHGEAFIISLPENPFRTAGKRGGAAETSGKAVRSSLFHVGEKF